MPKRSAIAVLGALRAHGGRQGTTARELGVSKQYVCQVAPQAAAAGLSLTEEWDAQDPELLHLLATAAAVARKIAAPGPLDSLALRGPMGEAFMGALTTLRERVLVRWGQAGEPEDSAGSRRG